MSESLGYFLTVCFVHDNNILLILAKLKYSLKNDILDFKENLWLHLILQTYRLLIFD